MSGFFEAYSQWSPANQMRLAVLVAVLACGSFLFVAGWALFIGFPQAARWLAVWLHGWPPVAKDSEQMASQAELRPQGFKSDPEPLKPVLPNSPHFAKVKNLPAGEPGTGTRSASRVPFIHRA